MTAVPVKASGLGHTIQRIGTLKTNSGGEVTYNGDPITFTYIECPADDGEARYLLSSAGLSGPSTEVAVDGNGNLTLKLGKPSNYGAVKVNTNEGGWTVSDPSAQILMIQGFRTHEDPTDPNYKRLDRKPGQYLYTDRDVRVFGTDWESSSGCALITDMYLTAGWNLVVEERLPGNKAAIIRVEAEDATPYIWHGGSGG